MLGIDEGLVSIFYSFFYQTPSLILTQQPTPPYVLFFGFEHSVSFHQRPLASPLVMREAGFTFGDAKPLMSRSFAKRETSGNSLLPFLTRTAKSDTFGLSLSRSDTFGEEKRNLWSREATPSVTHEREAIEKQEKSMGIDRIRILSN